MQVLRRRRLEESSNVRDLRGEEVDVLEEREVGRSVLLDLVKRGAHAGEKVLLHAAPVCRKLPSRARRGPSIAVERTPFQ